MIKRVPVKTLLQFRSVSKQWKSLIDSPNFADDFCLCQSQPRLLIRYLPFETAATSIHKYVSVADDDTLHQHQFPIAALPESVNDFKDLRIVGCSHGLVCLYAYDNRDGTNSIVVLWNPWIRKFVNVPVTNVQIKGYGTILGFGVSPQSKDPKIVMINSCVSPEADTSVSMSWRVEVFTLSSRTWKTTSGSIKNLPCRNPIRFLWYQVALDGVIYWKAFEWMKVDRTYQTHNLIMSFDLSSEGFEQVCLPDILARRQNYELSISKRMESVVVLEMDEIGTSVWVMGLGVTKSFTKLFTVMSGVPRVYGFMKNGEPIVGHESHALFVYDSHSGAIKDLGIVGHNVSFNVKSYMETLLLIDQ